MRLSRRLLVLASFVGLAAVAASAVARIGSPSPAPALLAAVLAGTLAGAPGLFHRRAAWASLALVPVVAWLLLRAELPAPSVAHGLMQQLSFYTGELRAGAHAYVSRQLPFDFGATPQIRVLLVFMVYAAVALAAVAALSLRRVVPAIVVLLVPFGFGLTIDQTDRVVWLPLAFLFLAGCLLMTSRSLGRGSWRPSDALAGVGTAVIAALLALSLLGTTPVAAGKPWGDWRTWGPISTDASTRLVFNWMENYPRLLDPSHNEEVMRVKATVPSYWRANALDVFTGTTWFSSTTGRTRVPAGRRAGSALYTVPVTYPQPAGRVVTEVFQTSSIYTDYLFAGGSARSLSLPQDVPVYTGQNASLAVDSRLGPKLRYAVTAVVPDLLPQDLVGRGRAYPQDIMPYLALPFPRLGSVGIDSERTWRRFMRRTALDREWLGLYKLDRRVVGRATDPYEIALRIEQFLRFNYVYTLTPPATSFESPYAAFLFRTRSGYCQHFAGAMAVLLRYNGIPARVAVGFTTGRRVNEDTFVVRRNDAHAWVEAYFPQVGWVAFDPTPGRDLPGPGPSSTSAGFVDPFTSGGAAGAAALPRVAAPDRRGSQQDPTAGEHATGAGSTPPRVSAPWFAWPLALLAGLALWPAVRAARRGARVRRGTARQRLCASLELFYVELRDYGAGVPPSQTLEETLALLSRRLGVDAGDAAQRVQAVLFGGREARASDVAALDALRRDVKRRLRAHAGVRRRLAAGYGLTAARPLTSR